jgi:hypothetical protein
MIKKQALAEKAYKTLYKDITDRETLRRSGLTLAELREAQDITRELITGETTASETISEAVSDLFRKFGFMVKEKGIGWRISFA